jgi:proton glutamate symport protein
MNIIRKTPLHWQIFISLAFAVVYGVLFPTKYSITTKDLTKFKQEQVPFTIIDSLKIFVGIHFNSRRDLIDQLDSRLANPKLNQYKSFIVKESYNNPAVNAVSWMGDIFLKALKMLILPLILFSIITGVSNIGTANNFGRLGLKTFVYYISTSLLAIITGLFFVNILKPGSGADLDFSEAVDTLVSSGKSLGQILMDIIPSNIFQAFVQNDTLAVIFFAMVMGFFTTRISSKEKDLLNDFYNASFELLMKVAMFIIKFTPLGVFGIVAKVVADQNNLSELAGRMGLYMFTVILGLAVHMFISLPILVRVFGKTKPFAHFRNMSTPLLTAFSTSSSGVTLPLTITANEKKSGVSSKISNFVPPLGATINMDGTALYECVAVMFIAQAYGIEMSFTSQVIIVITSLLASIGAAAIPMAGLMMMTIILSAVGLPLEGIGLVLAVDRILDMFRTSVNVWSDCCGTVIIAKSEGEKLTIDFHN